MAESARATGPAAAVFSELNALELAALAAAEEEEEEEDEMMADCESDKTAWGHSLVGRRLRVKWNLLSAKEVTGVAPKQEFFTGTVVSYSRERTTHVVLYDAEDEEGEEQYVETDLKPESSVAYDLL